MMFMQRTLAAPGVWNVEEFDPDPFMEQLNKQGLPWHEVFDRRPRTVGRAATLLF
jgi:saccharopine dehydrogenase (NAD+, L-lysine-forming)